MRVKKALHLLGIVLAMLPACTPGGEAGVTVTDPWGRTSPTVAQNGAFYMTLTNEGITEDSLLFVSSDACSTVELHEMYDKGDGVMGMRPVESGTIPIPAGGSAELKPGGLHAMCIGKQVEFAAGTEILLTLQFQEEGEMEVTAVIRDN